MRILLDSICSRCGAAESTFGLSLEEAERIASDHVCADGVKSLLSRLKPRERRVYGPGERTKLPEEKGL